MASSVKLAGSGTGETGGVPVVTSRISLSTVAGASPVTSTIMFVGDNNCKPSCGALVFGRKSAALVGSTVTPVMSTPDEKVKAKPVKRSGHAGGTASAQNGFPMGPGW
jgi:hypothetical protein